MIVPIVSFTSSFVLRASARARFTALFDAKIMMQFNKRSINVFSFGVYDYRILRKYYIFSNGYYFLVFKQYSSLINFLIGRRMYCSIYQSSIVLLLCFYSRIGGEVILAISPKKH